MIRGKYHLAQVSSCSMGLSKSFRLKARMKAFADYNGYEIVGEYEDAGKSGRSIEGRIQFNQMIEDNIYKILFYFDKMYAVMDEAERRHLMESLIDEVQIYEERQPNGQWLKSIKFKLPIIDEDMSLSLDNDPHIESVILMSRAE